MSTEFSGTGSRDDGGADLSELRGLPRGGALGPGKVLFRGQLFWQELLPEHVATAQLEFRIGMGDDKRNFARIPNDAVASNQEPLKADNPLLLSAAMCGQGREDEDEVAKLIRSTCTWGDHVKLRRLLASCFVPARSCATGLCEASRLGHDEVVQELLRARASASACDGVTAKTALHFACEEGHEELAKLLISAGADLNACDATGSSPCDLARERDLGMLAKRLEKLSL